MTRIQWQISGHWHMILCFLTNCASVLHCALTVLNKILTSMSLCCIVSSREILFFLNLNAQFFIKWQAYIRALHFNQGTKGYFNLTTAVFCQMATLSYIVHITHQKAQSWWECTVNYTTHRYGGYLIWNWILAFLDLLYKWRSMCWGNSHKVYEEFDVLFFF